MVINTLILRCLFAIKLPQFADQDGIGHYRGNKAATWGCDWPGLPAPRYLTHFAEEEKQSAGCFQI